MGRVAYCFLIFAKEKGQKMENRIAKLTGVLRELNAHDQTFAASLIAAYTERNTLTEKQWFWVGKLAERGADARSFSVRFPDGFVIENGEVIFAMFATAKAHKENARIRLISDDGKTLITLAQSRIGNVNLYGPGGYAGHVNKDNKLITHRSAHREAETICKMVQEFANNPRQEATKYGRKTHHCCFCGRHLTREESTTAGYGPVCAANHGLPWGEMDEEIDEDLADLAEQLGV